MISRLAGLCPVGFALAALALGCSPSPSTSMMDVAVDTGTDGDGGRGDVIAAPVAPVATWVLPRTGPNDFELPWPSDLALTPQGFVDLTYIPNPGNNGLVASYEQALAGRLDGFSPVGAVYFRFTVPIDPTSIPSSATESTQSDASVQIIDVDPTSPDHLLRQPAQFFVRNEAGRYWPANTLAVAPVYGYPLRPHTHYAVVVTSALHPLSGGQYMRDADFSAVLAGSGGDSAVQQARALETPVVAEVVSAGIPMQQILSLAAFTTTDPTAEMFRVADAVPQSAPPAILTAQQAPANISMGMPFTLIVGQWGPDPIYQTGALPYSDPGSGDLMFDSSGNPVQQTTEDITFALSIPPGTPPASGWPIAIYAHGTGGNSLDFVYDGTGARLAMQGVAVFGFDQIFNGARISGPETESNAELEFFNISNPLAARTNNRQACVDLVQAARLMQTLVIPAATAGTASDVQFDATHLMFFGHSQGSLNGPLWLASERGAGAAVLSGAAGTFALSLIEKTQPVNIPEIMAVLIGVSPASGELVSLHPIVTLAQMIVDVADPVNYARFIIREPRMGNAPHPVFQTEGFVDHFAPDDGIASLAMALGLPLINPVLQPVSGYELSGMPTVSLPLRLNVANMQVTAGWQQFDAPPNVDGHFVAFTVPDAENRAATFLGSAAHDPEGIPTLQ